MNFDIRSILMGQIRHALSFAGALLITIGLPVGVIQQLQDYLAEPLAGLVMALVAMLWSIASKRIPPEHAPVVITEPEFPANKYPGVQDDG